MADKYCMKFNILTLVDITETRARKGDNPAEWRQQQNFNTLIGCISLRANPTYNRAPKKEKRNIDNLGFSKAYKGKQNVWEFNFEIEYGYLDEAMLVNDLDLIPVINDLDETIKLQPSCFMTNNGERNIIFKYVDNE
jgi:hypothetical protein